ncbi:MAG: DUF1735 and LamG domain-containing protein [Prevotellaceae bacterium]|jgi:hypothetical protein|nr:DUF1735 and LamG domain-containing protein [Prevotellaceae bacterium]
MKKIKTNAMMKRVKTVAIAIVAVCMAGLWACSDDPDTPNTEPEGGPIAVNISGALTTPLVPVTVSAPSAVYTLTAKATSLVSAPTTVTFAIDLSLVEAYNRDNGTAYTAAPAAAVQLDGATAVIELNKKVSSEVTLRVASLDGLTEGREYLIPVTITGVQGSGEEAVGQSNKLYLLLTRVAPPLEFQSLNIAPDGTGDVSMYSSFIFDDAKMVTMSNGYTYEIKCYIDAWRGSNICRLCQFTSKTESGSVMLRFGETGSDYNALQCVNPGGNFFSTTRFDAGKWYLISIVYNRSTTTMYVNGEVDTERSASNHTSSFQRFEIGMSWASGYRQSQMFPGRIAEGRVWNRPLSADEIRQGICEVNPAANGLVAYWKFNEGSGHIFHDATGHGYDMDWSNTWRAPGEGDIEQIDLQSRVRWIFDDNNKCSN